MNAETLHAAAIWGNAGGDLFHPGTRINALGLAAQCSLETGNFRSKPMKSHNNYAGISCTPAWVRRGQKCFNASTWEHLDGEDVTLVKGFRSYPDLRAFLADYSRLIALYYPLAAANDDCVWLYLAGLVHGKGGRRWATDPHYFSKLVTMAVTLAPVLVGDRWGMSWQETLRNSYMVALTRGLPDTEMSGIILTGLGGAAPSK